MNADFYLHNGSSGPEVFGLDSDASNEWITKFYLNKKIITRKRANNSTFTAFASNWVTSLVQLISLQFDGFERQSIGFFQQFLRSFLIFNRNSDDSK